MLGGYSGQQIASACEGCASGVELNSAGRVAVRAAVTEVVANVRLMIEDVFVGAPGAMPLPQRLAAAKSFMFGDCPLPAVHDAVSATIESGVRCLGEAELQSAVAWFERDEAPFAACDVTSGHVPVKDKWFDAVELLAARPNL